MKRDSGDVASTSSPQYSGVEILPRSRTICNITDLPPDKLPVDGASAKAKEDGKAGEIPSIPAGKSAAVTLDLTPGKYVFICNIAGHYQIGMHTGFTVEAP